MHAFTLAPLMSNVNSLQKQVTEEFDLVAAQETVNALSESSLKWVLEVMRASHQPRFNKQSNPLPVALKLTQILCAEEIQLESALLYQIAKITRLFTECFISLAIQNKNPIYQTTKDKFISNFETVLRIIPDHQVATRYEVQCALAVARLAATEQYFFEKYSDGVADATSDLTGGAAIKFGVHFIFDTVKRINDYRKEQPWVYKVLDLSWHSHALIEGEKSYTLEQFYAEVKPYRDIHKIAFCAVETLAQLSQKDKKQLSLFLKGDHDKPGLLTFVDLQAELSRNLFQRAEKKMNKLRQSLEKSNSLEKSELPKIKQLRLLDPFWKVRYRALQQIDQLFENLKGQDKQDVVCKIAYRLPSERDLLVAHWIKDVGQTWKQNSELKSAWEKGLQQGEDELKKNIASKKHKKEEVEKKLAATAPAKSHATSSLQGDRGEFGEEESTTQQISDEERRQLAFEKLILEMTIEIEENNLRHIDTQQKV